MQKILIPWFWDFNGNELADKDQKLYHWNQQGGTTTWELPEGWEGAHIYELTETGNVECDDIAVINGNQITITAEASVPYVLHKADYGEGIKIEELTWQAPDLYLRYTKGSGNQALKLDLRSPVIFDRQKALYLADHIQGTVTLPGQTESIPLSGKLSTDWNNEQIQGEFFARVHGAPMSFLGESAGFDHPSIKGDIVFGRLELGDLSVFNSLQKAQQTLSIETADSEITSPTQTAEAPETADSEAVATKEPEAQPDAQVTDPVSPQENSEGLINANENSPSAPSEVINKRLLNRRKLKRSRHSCKSPLFLKKKTLIF